MGKSKGSNYKPSNKAKQRAEKAKDRKVEKVEGSVSVKSPKSKTPSKSPKKESSKRILKESSLKLSSKRLHQGSFPISFS